MERESSGGNIPYYFYFLHHRQTERNFFLEETNLICCTRTYCTERKINKVKASSRQGRSLCSDGRPRVYGFICDVMQCNLPALNHD